MATTTPSPDTVIAPGGRRPGAESTIDLGQLAGQTKTGRNRAVDLYRAVAMLAVAIGHWLVIVAYRRDGQLVSGNALEFIPEFQLLTWIFQVMPLFFVVGGFASAASLDSKGLGHESTAAGRADWIAGRLARLLPPVAALGTFWAAAMALGYFTGSAGIISAGAVAAAIPLWFLANYVADVILAPHVLPLFRRAPGRVVAFGLTLFALLEIVRVTNVLEPLGWLQHLPHVNWILGWFLFQVAGFAWKDGLLPEGRRLMLAGAGFGAVALGLVTLGPWPVSMVHFPGLANSPTHPPTAALLLFGAAQASVAMAAAPALTRWLERRTAAWKSVVGANSMAMTIYLWHMTAGVLVLAAFDALGLLSSAQPATAGWWLAKIAFLAASGAVLALIVPRLGRIERSALLATRNGWDGSPWKLLSAAIVVSMALKGWTSGNVSVIVPSLMTVVVITKGLERLNPRLDAGSAR